MAGNDDLIARLEDLMKFPPFDTQTIRDARTALTDRDAQIERLQEHSAARAQDIITLGQQIERLTAMAATLEEGLAQRGRTVDAMEERMYAAEARATTAERDLAEARAEVEQMKVLLEHIDALTKREDITAETKCIFISMDTGTALAKGGADGDA